MFEQTLIPLILGDSTRFSSCLPDEFGGVLNESE